MLDGQPEVMEGPMVAGQQYIAVSKEGKEGFFARFVLGGGTQEGKTYDDVGEFMTNTVYRLMKMSKEFMGRVLVK